MAPDDPIAMLLAGSRLVDLTHPLHEHTPVTVLPPDHVQIPGFSLKELSRFDARGPLAYKNVFTVGEHVGTHFDAPCHWVSAVEGEDVSQVPVERLVGPAVVIDKRAEAERDADYLLSVEEIKEFENEYGLPENGWLLLRTGWESRIDNPDAFLNRDASGAHSPGLDEKCARWIARESPLIGFGTECVGIDAGQAFRLKPPSPVHHYLAEAGKYGLAALANLGALPTTGALLVIAPLKIVHGSGSPMRVFAFVPLEQM